MYQVGTKVIHSLHGLGVVESIEQKTILGSVCSFAMLAFDRLQIMANIDQKSSMIRPLMSAEEVPGVLEMLKECDTDIPSNYTKRYNMNLEKVKSGQMVKLCEVIKSLTKLAKAKKLGHKDQGMLERARRVLAQELSYVTGNDIDAMEQVLDQTCIVALERELATV
jgi:CarD family transcriptional regulator